MSTSDYSIRKYLSHLSAEIHLLPEVEALPGLMVQEALAAAWSVSMSTLRRDYRGASDLLDDVAFWSDNDIPVHVIRKYYGTSECFKG